MSNKDRPELPPIARQTRFDRLTMMTLVLVTVIVVLAVAWVGPALAVERIIGAI